MLERVLYVCWTGDNPMSKVRRSCVRSLESTAGVAVVLVTPENVNEFAPSRHPAYDYLSATHRADYLRAHLMHHRGGGYIDVKRTTGSWSSAFDDLESSKAWVNGYREERPEDVAQVGGEFGRMLQRRYHDLLGCGSMICKPETPFTTKWLDGVEAELDALLLSLIEHPAVDPADHFGTFLDSGPSPYPVSWTQLLGNIYHPLCLEHVDRLLYTVPRLSLASFR